MELDALKHKTIKRARMFVNDNISHVTLDFTDNTDAILTFEHREDVPVIYYGRGGNTVKKAEFIQS